MQQRAAFLPSSIDNAPGGPVVGRDIRADGRWRLHQQCLIATVRGDLQEPLYGLFGGVIGGDARIAAEAAGRTDSVAAKPAREERNRLAARDLDDRLRDLSAADDSGRRVQ
ncbi:hypothetical protein D3C87_1409510 [compost metagenome]